jgi:hypothetical protein
LNHQTASTAKTIYIPLFPIADWLVQNWWALLFEPCRGETPPKEGAHWNNIERQWLDRHCLRVSDSALFLPYFHLYSNGPHVAVAWYEDPETGVKDSYCTSGYALLDRAHVEMEMREFVAEVLRMAEGVNDQRVDQLKRDWEAIVSADVSERQFCEAAGRMGLDPYAVEEWPGGLDDFLAGPIGPRMKEPIVSDFFEATEPENAPKLWQWIRDAQTHLELSGYNTSFTDAPTFYTGKDHGYYLANCVRQAAALPEGTPIENLEGIAKALGGFTLTFAEHNHIPSPSVNAMVGWVGNSLAKIAGPMPAREDNARFLMARGLYQAITGCPAGPRLLTRASTWDQQAGRAFAAELLAPKEALAENVRADMDYEEREAQLSLLAARYKVSTQVVSLQLQNQGIWRV